MALLVHRGELDDVAAALEALGAEVRAVASPTNARAVLGRARGVVGTPQPMLELLEAGGTGEATSIVVCEGLSRTLAARLDQSKIDYVLTRPVHPAALSLLLQHVFYRGPERRHAPARRC